MKLSPILLLVSCLALRAATEEQVSKRFSVQSGGNLVVDVDFGSVSVRTNATSEVVVEVVRKVTRASKAEEQAYLADRPITFAQDGNTVTLRSRAKARLTFSRGTQRTEGTYIITVPAQFGAQLTTAGGALEVSDLTGVVDARTSGGGLQFERLHGPLTGVTAGGAVRVADCEGTQVIKTSGGGISVAGGTGSFDGRTAGGAVRVKDFRGEVLVKSSGGGLTIENVTGKVDGTTSGGTISARFSAPLTNEVKLATSGGGVTLAVPKDSAFDLDASSSGGPVQSELAVSTTGKPSRTRLKGPVNGGGKPVVLQTSGGAVRVQKL